MLSTSIERVNFQKISGPGMICGRVINHRTGVEQMIVAFDFAGLAPVKPSPVILYAVDKIELIKEED